jgi:DMSO/TMAO reductase YedYZ molybdopterin-dependent catalytic subunit
MYKTICFSLLFASYSVGLSAAPVVAQDPSTYVTTSITVDGRVEQRLQLSVADLAKFPQQSIQEVKISGHHAPGELAKYQGVLLTDLLNQAKMTSLHRHDYRKSAIIATASDGYAVVFSWSELFNTTIGSGVLVVYLKNGQALDQTMGQIALISAQDTATGPRFVKWLKQISVVKLAD